VTADWSERSGIEGDLVCPTTNDILFSYIDGREREQFSDQGSDVSEEGFLAKFICRSSTIFSIISISMVVRWMTASEKVAVCAGNISDKYHNHSV
jgi:hypothetical protein